MERKSSSIRSSPRGDPTANPCPGPHHCPRRLRAKQPLAGGPAGTFASCGSCCRAWSGWRAAPAAPEGPGSAGEKRTEGERRGFRSLGKEREEGHIAAVERHIRGALQAGTGGSSSVELQQRTSQESRFAFSVTSSCCSCCFWRRPLHRRVVEVRDSLGSAVVDARGPGRKHKGQPLVVRRVRGYAVHGASRDSLRGDNCDSGKTATQPTHRPVDSSSSKQNTTDGASRRETGKEDPRWSSTLRRKERWQ